MARCRVLVALLVMLLLAGLQNGWAQSTPDSRRQLNQDIQNQQRQIQERSREIEQRVLDQQREEERYRREQDERRRREEWIEQQRQSGQPVIIIDPNRSRPPYDNRPAPSYQPELGGTGDPRLGSSADYLARAILGPARPAMPA